MIEYEYGVHCGDKDCHACGTQRYNCEELTLLDNKTDMETEEQTLYLNMKLVILIQTGKLYSEFQSIL